MQNHISHKIKTEAANFINCSLASNGRLEREPPAMASLSPRQIEIAGLVARGLCDKEIAGQLHLAEDTIGSHLKEIFLRCRVHSRTALAARFLQGQIEEKMPPLPHERGGCQTGRFA